MFKLVSHTFYLSNFKFWYLKYFNIGQIIFDEFDSKTKQDIDPTRTKLMKFTAKMAAWFVPEARPILEAWGKDYRPISKPEQKSELNIDYKFIDQSVREMTESLIEKKMIPIEKLQ